MELGRLNEAQDSLSRALELAPMNARTLATALSFIPYKQSDHRFAQLEAVHAGREKLPVIERVRFEFAMGKAMEGIGQYDRAFDAYDEANRLYRDIHPYDEAADVRSLQRTRDLFTPELLALDAAPAPAGAGEPRQRVPIFIVGMLRSGTTLVEQMLASHPAIFGAGELTILGEIAKKADLLLHERTSGESLRQALRKLGDEYLDQLWRHAPAAGYITDKLPGNYRHLGLIHLMLPDAKIIHCLREPMDSCFSCFSLHFKVGHYYSYDQATLGRQYLRYQQLMQHWRQVLPPGRVLDVCYEHVVADAEREARRLLDHLDLAWDPACLRFYETARAVRTASVAQVRKPIYASSVARWKHFEENLGVLLELVGPTAASPASIRTSVS
jgi:tetratricopeptide (TPR) repeat protein